MFKIWLEIQHVYAYNFGGSVSNLTKLCHAMHRVTDVLVWV